MNADMIHIDGASGEGGGQILRTSLALSAITGKPFVIERIRAGRSKSGLLRQHLTAVRAAAEVCGAKLQGAELRSCRLAFWPGPIAGGQYRFSIGTAGSASLVCQTVLPILLTAPSASEVVFEGGTHNRQAPPFDFLAHAFMPVLRDLGMHIDVTIERYGFYPAGGGRFRLHVRPFDFSHATPNSRLLKHAPIRSIRATVLSAGLSGHVAKRELAVVKEALNLDAAHCNALNVPSDGPGNAVLITLEGACTEVVTSFGERGRRAERVAQDAVEQAQAFLAAGVPVSEHLADQLLLPFALARRGAFRCGPLSSHATTNIDVIHRFLSPVVRAERDGASMLVRFGS